MVVIKVSHDAPCTSYRATFVDDPLIGVGRSPHAALEGMAARCELLALELRAEAVKVSKMEVPHAYCMFVRTDKVTLGLLPVTCVFCLAGPNTYG